MIHALVIGAAGGFVFFVLVAVGSDLRRYLELRVEQDASPRPRPREWPPLVTGLVDVTPLHLVTPRGVEIPSDLLQGELDLVDALDWLDYVENLG